MFSEIQNYIFDLDGTLVNSSKEVLLCFEKAFEKANYTIDKSRLNTDVIGPPLRDIVKLIAPELTYENKIDEIVQNYKQLYDYDENDISVMYDGIYDLLSELKKLGKNLFLATFKPIVPTKRIIKMFKMEDFFTDIYAIDKFGMYNSKTEMLKDIIKNYKLNPSQTVMIGDAETDVTSAKESGIKSIGVLWGYCSDKTRLTKSSDYIVSNTDELKNIFTVF